MRIVISTCDKYINVLEAVKYTMDKFDVSGLDVTVLGFQPPNFDMGSWEFVSLGKDSGVQNFSNDIIPFFEIFNDEYFILITDDYVMTNRFNHKFFAEILEFVKTVPNFGRMWLMKTPGNYYGGANVVTNFGEYQIAEIHQGGTYRLSLQHSLWKTSYFKKYLVPNLNPWQWETRNSANYDGAAILLPVNNYVFNAGHVMIKGKVSQNWHKSIYDDAVLNQEDINNITEIFKKHKLI